METNLVLWGVKPDEIRVIKDTNANSEKVVFNLGTECGIIFDSFRELRVFLAKAVEATRAEEKATAGDLYLPGIDAIYIPPVPEYEVVNE